MLFHFEHEQESEGGEQEIPCEELMRSCRVNRHNRAGGKRGSSYMWRRGKHCPDI